MGSESTWKGREDLHLYKVDLADRIFGAPELQDPNFNPQSPKADFFKKMKICFFSFFTLLGGQHWDLVGL